VSRKPGSPSTRLAWILAAAGAAGILCASAETTKGKPPQPPAIQRTGMEYARLKALVEAGESAVESKDWDAAIARADEADVLVADWPESLLQQPEVAALLQRLEELEKHLPDSEEITEEPGLKEPVEVGPLTGKELETETEQVLKAEVGAVFDFPIDLNDKVLAWVHLFTTSRRGFMERTLSRASQYLPMVRQIFAEEGVPQDLAYLAVIESGYINTARSYAQAVGMWQFMRSTGRIYGLNGNAWVEERRDPVKATRAAARYLKRLYETSGDWYLALVGYNAGPLTTERAIQNLGSRNFWDMARSRWLRNQTKNYVPELCAAILIGRFPERYGFKVEQVPPYVYEVVEVDRMTSLAVLSRYAECDVEIIKELNPELLRATTPPGTYKLRVPPGMSQATARALARIPANQRLDFKPYRIRRGDTLARLASRFNVSVDDLLAANNLTKSSFKVGRTIQVPPPPPTPIDERDLKPKEERARSIANKPLDSLPDLPPTPAASSAAEPGEEETGAELPRPEPPVAPAKPAPAPRVKPSPVKEAAAKPSAGKSPAPKAATHLVKRGETLFAIAERYGVEVKDLRKWNRIKGTKIQAGQRLKLHR
jgi:membrane-bound lytic murein transglycosylase D